MRPSFMNHFTFAFPFLLGTALVFGAEPAAMPTSVGVPDLVRQALESNPERQAYVAALAAARTSSTSASSPGDPALSLEVGHKRLRDAAGAHAGEGEVWVASLSQTFEWPERLRLRRALADADIEMAKLGLERFEQALGTRATVLAYRLSRAQLRAQATAEVAERFAGLRKSLLGRDPSGPGPLVEMRAVEAAEVLARRRAEDARLALQQALLEVNQLRGAPLLAPLVVRTPSVSLVDAPGLEQLLGAAEKGNFGYRMRVLESEQASLQSDLSRSDSVPGFTAGPYVSQDRVAGRETIIGLRFEIPLPVTNRRTAADRTAVERRRQARASVDAAKRDMQREVAQTLLAYASKVDQLRMHQDDPAERFAEAARTAERHFRAGAIGFQLFMEAQSGYLDAVDAALVLQEEAVESGLRLRELTGADFTPVTFSR